MEGLLIFTCGRGESGLRPVVCIRITKIYSPPQAQKPKSKRLQKLFTELKSSLAECQQQSLPHPTGEPEPKRRKLRDRVEHEICKYWYYWYISYPVSLCMVLCAIELIVIYWKFKLKQHSFMKQFPIYPTQSQYLTLRLHTVYFSG